MLRYGSVPYLNAAPLLEGLADEVGEVRLAVPSELSRLLRDGELDVALAPVVAAFETPGSRIVPVGAVVARGAVKSVLLFTRGRPEDAKTVALDRASRTSAALVRVLYRHRWGTSPTFVQRESDPDLRGLDTDAALLIGDPALRAIWDGPPPVDLGAAWNAWTGLPFVFATWLARTPEIASEAIEPLARAAHRGRERLLEIAARGAADVGLDDDAARRYLREHLSFEYGRDEHDGLMRFRELWMQTPGLCGLDSGGQAV